MKLNNTNSYLDFLYQELAQADTTVKRLQDQRPFNVNKFCEAYKKYVQIDMEIAKERAGQSKQPGSITDTSLIYLN